ncbi:hypothetical protein QNI19_18885 [Cytophagaceae bacterium DM2B3-1]|uniref:Uncharacterized protein n=1 Tax=Xanthocytophaga flava TaxID=3048013 RepID=A0ABT7CMV0_9BACT|nr:hypothetical protein [Xanthocytophaga flavus]MDJ1495012.1 hypothetical protein [Xanthocytophaga flavus]
MARDFENQALAHFSSNHTLDGFVGGRQLAPPNFRSFTENAFLAITIGGTQGVKVEIRLVNSHQIRVRYTIYDVFGAGRNDATGRLIPIPGLQSMFELQHYRNTRPNTRNLYRPFLLGVITERIRVPKQ